MSTGTTPTTATTVPAGTGATNATKEGGPGGGGNPYVVVIEVNNRGIERLRIDNPWNFVCVLVAALKFSLSIKKPTCSGMELTQEQLQQFQFLQQRQQREEQQEDQQNHDHLHELHHRLQLEQLLLLTPYGTEVPGTGACSGGSNGSGNGNSNGSNEGGHDVVADPELFQELTDSLLQSQRRNAERQRRNRGTAAATTLRDGSANSNDNADDNDNGDTAMDESEDDEDIDVDDDVDVEGRYVPLGLEIFSIPLDESVSLNSSEATSASPGNMFSVYNSAMAMYVDDDVAPICLQKTGVDQILAGVLCYNMGLAFHRHGLYNPGEEHDLLFRALQFYVLARSLICVAQQRRSREIKQQQEQQQQQQEQQQQQQEQQQQQQEQRQQEEQQQQQQEQQQELQQRQEQQQQQEGEMASEDAVAVDTYMVDVDVVMLALLNNTGHLYSHFRHHDEARVCRFSMLEILARTRDVGFNNNEGGGGSVDAEDRILFYESIAPFLVLSDNHSAKEKLSINFPPASAA